MSRILSSRLVVAAALGLAAFAGCAPEQEAPATLVSLALRSATPEVARGRTAKVAAIAGYSDGSAAVVTSEAEWTSDSADILSVEPTGPRGTVRANSEGRTTVTARFEGLEASTTITVTPHAVEGLRIERSADGALPVGVGEQLRAVAVYSDGRFAEVTTAALWKATGDAVIVDPASAGRVVAASEGKGTVRALFEGASAESAFEVTAAVVARVELDPPAPALAHGTDVELHATAVYTDGATADVTAAAEWQIDDASVLAFDEEAFSFHGVAPGKATVTARFDGVAGAAPVTVTPATLTEVTLSPQMAVVQRGVRVRFTAVGHFTDGSVQDLSGQAAWSSTAPEVADLIFSVRKGDVAAISVGQAQVRATVAGFEAIAPITVNAAQLVSMQVVPAAASVAKGNTVAVAAIGTWSDSSTSDLTAQVAWSSEDPAVATIDAGGLVHAQSEGQVTLTATYQGLQPSAVVTVTAPTVNTIALTGAIPHAPRGTTFTLSALGTFSDGHVEDVSAAAVWSTTNPVVAAISNATATRGQVTALEEGVVHLQAAFAGVVGDVTVEVTPEVVDHLELTPGTITAPLGETVVFSAKQIFTDGTVVPLAGLAQWSTSSPMVAVVDAAGNAVALAQGTAVITVTDGGHSVSAFLQVIPPVLESITVSQPSLALPLGTGAALKATARWTDGTTQDVTGSASWTAVDAQVAQVSAAGIVQPLAVGQTEIEVGWGGVVTTMTIEVLPAAVVSVELTPAGAAISVGQTLPLSATALYTDNHMEDVSAQANWASTDTSVATVTQGTNGWQATGVAPGGVELRVYFSGFVGSGFFTVQ